MNISQEINSFRNKTRGRMRKAIALSLSLLTLNFFIFSLTGCEKEQPKKTGWLAYEYHMWQFRGQGNFEYANVEISAHQNCGEPLTDVLADKDIIPKDASFGPKDLVRVKQFFKDFIRHKDDSAGFEREMYSVKMYRAASYLARIELKLRYKNSLRKIEVFLKKY